MSSRAEQKAAAREARIAAERAAAGSAARRRRLTILGGVAAAAAVIVVAVILLSQGGTKSSTSVSDQLAALDGIPQSGPSLGRATAPVTVQEFADLQCPFCAQFATHDFTGIVRTHVRNGQVRMRLQLLTFIGPDSLKAGRVATAAGLQNREWQFVEAFYAVQKPENTGYVTDAFLRDIGSKVPGLDINRALRDASSPAVTRELTAAQAAAQAAGINSTPTFLVTPRGGKTTSVTSADLGAAITAALKSARPAA